MMESYPGPERLLWTETVYDGREVQVRVDEVTLARGGQTRREVVQHQSSVAVVPVDAEDNVVMVRQYRHPAGAVLLEVPAGKIDGAEAPEAAAQRELREEAGFASNDLRGLGQFWVSPGYCTERMHVFYAGDLVPSTLEADMDEDIRTEKVPLSDIARLIREGELQDGKSIAALLMVLCIFKGGPLGDG